MIGGDGMARAAAVFVAAVFLAGFAAGAGTVGLVWLLCGLFA